MFSEERAVGTGIRDKISSKDGVCSLDDKEILSLFEKRDPSALEYVGAKYGAYCSSIAVHILHDPQDVEECVNETWWRAWQSIPPAFPPRLRLYLGKITRNLAFDTYRKQRAEKRGGGLSALEELDECTADLCNVENEIQARQLRDAISDFLRGQSDRNRTVFVKRYFYAQDPAEIADAMGISENYTAVILGRMRKKLHQYLVKEGFGI